MAKNKTFDRDTFIRKWNPGFYSSQEYRICYELGRFISGEATTEDLESVGCWNVRDKGRAMIEEYLITCHAFLEAYAEYRKANHPEELPVIDKEYRRAKRVMKRANGFKTFLVNGNVILGGPSDSEINSLFGIY